jgi:hypothetical protein
VSGGDHEQSIRGWRSVLEGTDLRPEGWDVHRFLRRAFWGQPKQRHRAGRSGAHTEGKRCTSLVQRSNEEVRRQVSLVLCRPLCHRHVHATNPSCISHAARRQKSGTGFVSSGLNGGSSCAGARTFCTSSKTITDPFGDFWLSTATTMTSWAPT